MTDKLDRLPKWAREEIEHLRRNLDYAIKDRDELRLKAFGGSGKVCIDEYGIDESPDTALADNARIRFTLDDGHWIQFSHRGDAVHAMSDTASLVTIASCPNVVGLKVIR